MAEHNKITLICGHYGCGKTNLAINLAIDRVQSGQATTLVDLDIVNPYFRSADYRGLLEEHGVRVIAPRFAATNLDLPALPPDMYAVFARREDVIFDVGGDDVGARTLGRFRHQIEADGYDLLYVVNRYRALTQTPAEAVTLLHEIEEITKLRATAIVNNSHLKQETTAQTIAEGMTFAEEIARLTGLPLRFTTSPIATDIENVYPVRVYVTTPWECF